MLQNFTLMALAPLLLAAVALMVAIPGQALVLALAHIVAAGTCGLIWSHHAARTTQIKYYMRLIVEPQFRTRGGWERWHATHRVAGWLGSRWRISTIGVFLGSQIAALGFGLLVTPANPLNPLVLLAVALIAGSALLLMPPKMSPALRAEVASDQAKL
jgi:hypothetical protein